MFEDLLEKLNRLEYHQSLLLKMVSNSEDQFYKLIIEKRLSERDVEQFNQLCEDLSNKLKEQKAEGFVYFYPLFEEFKSRLHPSLHASEVIKACQSQRVFPSLMEELKNYL